MVLEREKVFHDNIMMKRMLLVLELMLIILFCSNFLIGVPCAIYI